MRIGLVSDTHMFRYAKKLPRALVDGFKKHGVSAILHMGDFTDIGVVEHFEALAPFDAVAGNNDSSEIARRFGRRKIVEVGDVRIGMVHGDGEMGTTMQHAQAAFADERLDVILFGHSHNPYCQRHGRMWIVNPGSPTDRRRNPAYSYGILSIDAGLVEPSLHFYVDKSP